MTDIETKEVERDLRSLRYSFGYEDAVKPQDFDQKADPIVDRITDGIVFIEGALQTARAAISEGIFAGYAREEIGIGTDSRDASTISTDILREFFPTAIALVSRTGELIFNGILDGAELHNLEQRQGVK